MNLRIITFEMPELPEVELQRRYFWETSLNKRIVKIDVLDEYVVKNVTPLEFIARLEGAEFQQVKRRGKFLEVSTDSEHDLVIHFGMTGSLKYGPKVSAYDYTRVVFSFAGDFALRYLSKRKLGGLFVVPREEFNLIKAIRHMGPEPLCPDFQFSTFKDIVSRRSALVKSLLLDQSFIAGIGNLYSDEILFQSGIRPDRKISDLNDEELAWLFKEIKRVLKIAVQTQTTFQGLESQFLTFHRGKGEKCPKCGAEIQRMRNSGRTSYYCSRCQQ